MARDRDPDAAAATTLDRYRDRWCWDGVSWGTHCLNCLGTCPYRVYVRDGRVAFEEPAASLAAVEAGVPDMNPLSCQKGSAWSCQLEAEDRVLHPMRRKGERGSGEWEQISWDEALTDVAEAIVEAIDIEGPESIVFEETVEGGLLTQAPLTRFAGLLGAVTLDANGLVNDFPVGHHMTFGKFSCASTVDDTFHAGLVLLWHSNPAYTSIPYFHYVAEARYRGATVVTIAPDYSASAALSDIYAPVIPGTDAALALAMCKVVVDEDLADWDFVRSQTDLPLLVVRETGRFLRAADVDAGGAEDVFHIWDAEAGLRPASRSTLELGGIMPELEGAWTATLHDGTTAEVTTVFALLRERLGGYTPEQASEVCGVAPDVIRQLARLAASRPTKVLEGFNACKYFHGDLMERSMCLLLALTGNWGRPGTGIQGLALAGLDGYFLFPMKTRRGVDETAGLLDGIDAAMESLRETDPDASDEVLGNQLLQMAVVAGTSTPPVFFNYHHVGYRDAWNRAEWADPTMSRSFDDYLRDAVQRGWWGGLVRPGSGTDPQVFFAVGTNPLRRSRGGRAGLLDTLWPLLEMVVVVDFRMSTTALHADIVLPAAMQYERPNVQYALTHTFRLAYSDAAVAPGGESKTEWEIFRLLAEKVEEVAAGRGLSEYLDGRRRTRRLDDLVSSYTLDGAFEDESTVVDEWVRDSAEAGTLPVGTSLERLRAEGSIRFSGLGMFAPGLSVAGDVSGDSVLTAYTWHVERGVPYPTLTRRAQFYIDHPWFLEADEALPRHKDTPRSGGDLPFVLTSGHSRWTVHSIAMGNDVLLETHQGRPLVVVNTGDARRHGIADGDEVRVFNDHGEFRAPARVAPRVRPGQVIVYNGFEPHMFPAWRGANEVEPGMVKWLHLVGRYGHLRYLPFGWQPVPADRAVAVDISTCNGGDDA
ncbi:MAG: molybdopterin-dependent oxidoreductase [Acidimicrobiia bacterium]|nr:molybdopterin-dependent oxidoreductase [Acidimicrobiia bacterium]